MNQHRDFLLLLFGAALLLLVSAGSYGVIESSDARYAEIAREMYHSQEWLHPNLLHIHHYHKPPITYQITALGYELFGVTHFGARFFLQLAILVQLVLVYLLTLEFSENIKTALYAAAIYFSFPIVLIASRNLTTDAFLTTFALFGIYAWVRYRKEERVLWLYGFTISLAFGFLTKGPVVFLAPFIFALLYNRFEESKQPWQLHHLFAWLLFVLISASWFVYLALDNPAFWNYFIERQTVERFSQNVFDRSEPFWYFIVLAPLLGMPWLLLLPWFALKLRITFNLKQIESILLIAVAIPLLFFSISTSKRVLYILPLYPLLAVALGLMLEKLKRDHEKFVLLSIFTYALILFVALGIAPWVPSNITFPPLLTASSLLLILWLYLFFQSPNVTTKSKSVIVSFVSAAYFLLSATWLFNYSVQSFNIATPVATWIKEQNLSRHEILVYNKRLPSLAFELDRPIISLYDGDQSLNREVQFERDTEWKNYLYNLTQKEEQQRLRAYLQNKPSLLVLYKRELSPAQMWLKELHPHHIQLGRWHIYYQRESQ